MVTAKTIETLAAAILFASIFYFGARLRIPGTGQRYHRRILSFAAGVSIAYVFIHLLPELENAKNVFLRETAHRSLPFPEYRVYLSAMMGFMLFYGIEHMVVHRKSPEAKTGGPVFMLHIGGFAAYAWLISYLLVRSIGEGGVSIALYAVAMGLHFLSIDHALRREHGLLYEGTGKNVLALAALAGWSVGMLAELPKPMVITLLGIVSGAIIMNSMIMELPKEKEGKFASFLIGGIFYTVLLFLVG